MATTTGSRTSPRAQTDRLADAVLTASRVLVAVAARSLAEHESEVSLPQYRALVVLGSRGSQRPVDLAQALGVDPSTATRMCDRLVRKHLITRRRDVVDRRVVLLDLSAAGRRLVDRVTRRRRQEIGRILEAVDPAEHGALVRAFTTFGQAAGEVPEDDWQRSWDL
ncbi:MAG TPA: MarR family winged helix-turn-helix transcriptional regulator [Acidimicrobiales bacterium]|nr:MarR family winged helix-turn-helix transcriptional regulator [Acidimicrobiales bacterium]